MAAQPRNINILIEAFEKFRSALLIYFIGVLIGIGAAFSLIGALTSDYGISSLGVGSLAGLVVGGILALVGIVMLFQSAGLFAEFDPERLGGFRTGLRLQLVAIILFIIAALVANASVGVGLGLLIIAAIIGLVGVILVGIFFLRLGDLSKEGLPVPDSFRLVGILYLVGIIIGILQLIALIMAYVYAGDAIKRLREHASAAPSQGLQPSQPGQGF